MTRFFLAMAAALTLAGCDMVGDWIGIENSSRNGSGTNRSRTAAADDGLISNLQPIGEPAADAGQAPPDAPPEDGSQPPTAPDGQVGPQDGAATGAIDPSMIVGRWGDNGNCAQVIQFMANGTFRAPNGGQGNWRLAGDRLTMFAGARSATFRLRSVTPQRIVAEDSSGQLSQSTRC
jgi:hypothetical protein